MKNIERVAKAEEVSKGLAKLSPNELNRIAGYVEGLISAKELYKERMCEARKKVN